MKAEIKIVIVRVIANSLNKRPIKSCIKNSGISTAVSEMVKDIIVKPICSAPLMAACRGSTPSSI